MTLEDSAEDLVWKTINPNDIWVLDKLILSRKLGYICGPVGLDVPVPGYYIVRPCVNMLGLGLGAQKVWIDKDTTTLTLGYFWCEWFEGKHLSIDYQYGLQKLCVEGIKEESTFTKWSRWNRVSDCIPCPRILDDMFLRYKWLNCEFINSNLIEVHLRHNEDFDGGINYFIPVWQGEDTTPPDGFKYRDYPDVHGRVGAFIK